MDRQVTSLIDLQSPSELTAAQVPPLHQKQQQQQRPRRAATRGERSCDTCRRRKLRCVREPEQERPGKKRRSKQLEVEKAATVGSHRDDTDDDDAGRARLSLTLGLHPTTHFKYIGPGSLHEDMLLDFIDPSFRYHNDSDASKFCRVAEGVTFLARLDSAGGGESENSDAEAVERLVRPHGPGLVDLYFRIVHPSYPILHKGVFLERYRRMDRATFLPAPLLAAVYLLAMDWWEYDQAPLVGPVPQLSLTKTGSNNNNMSKPDGDALARIASRALMAEVVHRPKLSTVQACLLLLQRAPSSDHTGNSGDSWVLTSQLVAVAEELGLHVDCGFWNIPAWEKGLRRRLAWAALMQDKWSSLIYGRPSHVQASHWRIPPLTIVDFWGDNDTDDSDGTNDSTEVDKGRLLFIHLARLTEVMAGALATFYSHDSQRHAEFSASDAMHTIELVKSVALQLRAWATGLPACLRMEAVRPRKLCSNGYLHLSYFVTEIMIYRCIVRSLARSPPQRTDNVSGNAALLLLCREAAKTRLLHVMRFVEGLRPEHLQAFWWFASAKSLAYIRTYVSILWATSSGDAEAEFYRQKLDEFRWSLRVRARGVAFVTAALREMGESLEDIDMSRSPFVQRLAAERAARSMQMQVRIPSMGDTMDAVGSTEVTHAVESMPVGGTVADTLAAVAVDPLLADGNDLDDMALQTTPEFLADFGVSASETLFADIKSLHLQLYPMDDAHALL
ncbi:uncharacterized protein SPSK_02263 [Sporothrix schenckii 1099-18]|uniref:Xylanolytic transcriptional activator regulatory domain-containing protein n=1 Tax=Sporothrix schenckii 1099-18 TaxID=1397361 RepID=A0A0F2MCN9_SPOSC|nr:uncharacterized protein SPSK_02263 [Sporothrix schenckii 1099-18]KJR86849.1 hypothetical protein SPSK_02263 [Sporothrix schenckii 1099-18]